jgi:peptidyl-tRNA hydrolase, PTH1 family
MKIIVGLGNPGEKYYKTRHNLGFEVLDALETKYLPVKKSQKFWTDEKKFKAEIGKLVINNDEVLLVKPLTFMNLSGKSVSLVKNYYKTSPDNLIVIHDDLDLLLGKIKVRVGGAAAGHHGVESVIKELGTDQFIRIRLGIGNEKSHLGENKRQAFNAERFVVEEFLSKEQSTLKHTTKRVIEAVELILKDGVESAQNQFN